MTGYEVYQTYLAVRSHFTRPEYDFFKFRGKTKASVSSFEKRKDVYFFKKLASKLTTRDEVLYYMVSNFISDNKGYIRSFSHDVYAKWKAKQESFTYKFIQDIDNLLNAIEAPYEQNFDSIFNAEKGRHPILLRKYFGQEVSLETLVVLEHCLGFVQRFDKELSDPIWTETRNVVVKYQPFLNIDCKKYKKVILETVQKKL